MQLLSGWINVNWHLSGWVNEHNLSSGAAIDARSLVLSLVERAAPLPKPFLASIQGKVQRNKCVLNEVAYALML